MARWALDAMMDASLQYLKDNVDKIHLCEGQPTDYADALTRSKGNFAVTAPDWTGPADYTGTGGGRQITVAAEAGVAVTADGTIDHYAFVDEANTTLRYVNVTDSVAVTNGGTVDVGAATAIVADPAVPPA